MKKDNTPTFLVDITATGLVFEQKVVITETELEKERLEVLRLIHQALFQFKKPETILEAVNTNYDPTSLNKVRQHIQERLSLVHDIHFLENFSAVIVMFTITILNSQYAAIMWLIALILLIENFIKLYSIWKYYRNHPLKNFEDMDPDQIQTISDSYRFEIQRALERELPQYLQNQPRQLTSQQINRPVYSESEVIPSLIPRELPTSNSSD
jgi:hypothetical protein